MHIMKTQEEPNKRSKFSFYGSKTNYKLSNANT